MDRRYRYASVLLAGASAVSLSLATQAAAQEQAAGDVGEIVVTGTRVGRQGFAAPTPVTVVDSQVLEGRAPSVLINALVTLPAVRGTATPTTASQSLNGTGGGSFVNLRGLGPNRTLVLVNGQRIVATTNTGASDIAMLPQILVDRVDIVTGGASAAYGSDAVAGVTNFVLNSRLNGFKANIEGAVSSRGDAGAWRGALAWGGQLSDKLHVVLGGEYYHSDGLGPRSRPWALHPIAASGSSLPIPNPNRTATNGQKVNILANYSYIPNISDGGVIVGGPLADTEFLPGGATATFQNCGGGPIAGQTNAVVACRQPWDAGRYIAYYTYLASPQDRYSGYARADYALNDQFELHADAMVARSKTSFVTIPPSTSVSGRFTIRRDNAYLPASVATRMDTAGVSTFSLARYTTEFGPTRGIRTAELRRGSLSLDGEVGAWRVNAWATYGESDFNYTYFQGITPRFNQAVDAVRNSAGQVVCRSTLTDPTNGCVPVNLFGVGSISPEGAAYVFGRGQSDLLNKQFATAAGVDGEPFSTWAGPVSIGAGVEYRWESSNQTVDALSLARAFNYTNNQPLTGSQDVVEGYAETVVPLAKVMPWARNLEFNGALRVTHYSSSGSVTTWKAGGNYVPVDGVRFRTVYSRDIRAPNILELFTPSTQLTAQASATDPRTGQIAQFPSLSAGNPNLTPEIARTLSGGVVLQPAFLPGFSASVDYYRIRVKDAIQTVAIQQVLNGCQAGEQTFCDFVTRNTAGQITSVTTSYLNVSSVTTAGVDFEVAYRFPLAGGAMDVRALANYLDKYVVDTGATRVDSAGDLGQALAKWGWDFSAAYTYGEWMVMLNANGVGSGVYSQNSAPLIENSRLGAVWTLGATIERRFQFGNHRVTAYVRGENLLDRPPPAFFGGQGANYDRIGANFRAGLRATF